jgi:hypothetical protein
MDSWILKMVRVRSLRRIVAWALVLGCIVLLAAAEQRYISNFMLGSFDLAPSDLDSIRDVSDTPRYFARVTGSKSVDTGIKQIRIHKRGSVETSREVSGAYYALVIGDRLLLVKGTANMPTTVEGELTVMPGDLDRLLFDTREMQAIRTYFYPFYLDNHSFRFPGYCAMAGALLFAFLLVKYGRAAWRHLQDPASHPVVKRLVSWDDRMGIAMEAERESRSPHYQSGGWRVTDKYLIQSTFFTFNPLRFSDLLWAYKKVTRHYHNFIPCGKTYEAVLVCDGDSATVTGPEKMVDAILGFAGGRTPWAVYGFSKELEELFTENTQAFCAAVEQRRRDWAQQARV